MMQDDEQSLNRHLKMRRKPISSRTACVGALTASIAILVPVFRSAHDKASSLICQNNVKQLSRAMLLYALDWDEHLPSAARWGDSITKYLARDYNATNGHGITSLFHCRDAASPYSYAFNRRLDHLALEQIEAPSNTVLLFEADVSTINAAGDRSLLPLRPRHSGALNIGFADGHVKWDRQAYLLRWQP
jgi:prepilin-type processing-associated H-X9-DG protein